MSKIIYVIAGLIALLGLSAGSGCSDDEKKPAVAANNAANNTNNGTDNNVNNTPNNAPNNNNCTPGEPGCGVAGQVSDPAARSCEVVLRETGATIQGATFGEGVTGQVRRQAPNVAVAFVRNADAPFEGAPVALQVDGAADGFTVRSVTCFDNTGAALAGAEVKF